MPDLSPQSPEPQTDARRAAKNGDGGDPLARLHRMSRTAGLGAQDYVAINVAAVLSVLLGLLLVIPLAGVICGIVALHQIKDSNGTQTGRGIAWTGIALSVLFAAVVGGRELLNNVRTRSDREVVVLCDLHEMSYEEAAAALDCAVGTVRSRLHRARALLVDKLRDVREAGPVSNGKSLTRCIA